MIHAPEDILPTPRWFRWWMLPVLFVTFCIMGTLTLASVIVCYGGVP